MMPQSAQNLYFHLGMNADDDGYCEHFTIMRMTESKPDDLKILNAKEFVQVFDEKVLVIMDWKENNYIRSDRYTPSKYLEIYKDEIKKISETEDTIGTISVEPGIPDDNQKDDNRDTQVRLGKVSKGKDNIFSESFNKFWYLYDKKIGKMKSVKLWNKIHPGIHIVIYRHVETYVKSTPDKQYRKNPDVYLRNQCWNDEIINNNETKYPYEKFVNNR